MFVYLFILSLLSYEQIKDKFTLVLSNLLNKPVCIAVKYSGFVMSL